jgi:release factor glutamine methyltransferase
MKNSDSIRKLIRQASAKLAEHGIISPERNARMLMAHAMSMPEWKISMHQGLPTEGQYETFQHLIQRRSQREPIQHLIGSIGFHDLEVRVSRAALIPRPETELLVETALEQIKESEQDRDSIKLLDMGTGTGCIALSMARALPKATVWCADISKSAITLAHKNAQHLGLEDQLHFVQSDLWKAFEGTEIRWNGILSNPPYIPTQEIQKLQPEVRDHDPILALDGGTDGLVYYRALAIEAPKWLSNDGFLCLECGKNQADPIIKLFKKASWFAEKVVRDYSNIQRVVVFRRE